MHAAGELGYDTLDLLDQVQLLGAVDLNYGDPSILTLCMPLVSLGMTLLTFWIRSDSLALVIDRLAARDSLCSTQENIRY